MKKLGISAGVLTAIIVGVVVALSVGHKNDMEAFALVAGERPSWNFEGTHEASEQLTLQVENEIDRLKGLLGTGEFPDYDIYVGIAGQYELLGEGKKSYEYLQKAIVENEARSLAYSNMGTLLGKLGAKESAKIAYEMALDRDDTVTNRINYIQHLEQYYTDDLDLVESAHTFALEKFPNSEVLQQRYESFKKLHDR
ncbi:MAG: hypothetical protein ACJKSS_01170 [Patescibacteria group bacterium UBA2103]